MKSKQDILKEMNSYTIHWQKAKNHFDKHYAEKQIVLAASDEINMHYNRGIWNALFKVVFPNTSIPFPITMDVGLGKCQSRWNCTEWAVTHYNPTLPVCKSCDDSLENEFEEEYR